LREELVHIIGGGLAGAEAAWQAARAGLRVILYEMRPLAQTGAHRTGLLAELVCSNSLKTEQPFSAPWLLKEELRRLGSLLLKVAAGTRAPGGHALVVDREAFGAEVTRAIAAESRIEVRRQEVTAIPENSLVVIASGPLTSPSLAADIARCTGAGNLYFYDSISPIIEAASINRSVAFQASRYGKSLDAGGDYLNCPLTREEYDRFVNALLAAEKHEPHIQGELRCFEACLPIEELARRGRDTLRFGPMKPTGLTSPRSGRRPYAVVQLRQENLRASSYNMVGFQTSLKHSEQARVFRMIPGLENAAFLRYGQMHRNTYINAPALLTPALQLRTQPRIFFAGQIAGVEGYVEAIATGLLAGRGAAALARGAVAHPMPRLTALGSLSAYVSGAEARCFQPANMTFDLLPPLGEEEAARLRHDRLARREAICRRALASLDEHLEAYG